MDEFKIGDKIVVINGFESTWSRSGSKGTIRDISTCHKAAKVDFYSGDFDEPGSWWIQNDNMMKLPLIKKTYKLTVEK